MSQHKLRTLGTFKAMFIACAAVTALGSAHAATVLFEAAPFQGSTANPDDGVRTVFGGNELFLNSFDVGNDRFEFDAAAFGLSGELSFANGLAKSLSPKGSQVIVLQDSDNDANPSTAFNAGAAANLIADAVEVSGDGFFVYWNSSLNVNRLVYSTDLGSRTADLAILARIQSPTGPDAIHALPTFSSSNFAVSPVPEPASLGMFAAGLGVLAWRRRAVAKARSEKGDLMG